MIAELNEVDYAVVEKEKSSREFFSNIVSVGSLINYKI